MRYKQLALTLGSFVSVVSIVQAQEPSNGTNAPVQPKLYKAVEDAKSKGEEVLRSDPGEGIHDLEMNQRDKPSSIKSGPCPLGCNQLGFSSWGCKEWKEGDICFIGPK